MQGQHACIVTLRQDLQCDAEESAVDGVRIQDVLAIVIAVRLGASEVVKDNILVVKTRMGEAEAGLTSSWRLLGVLFVACLC